MEISETELLIRSASTLLSLVNPRAIGLPKRRIPERKSAQLLDRLSTLFVSGRHNSGAAAISLIFSPDKKLYVVATAQGEREEFGCQAGEPLGSSDSHLGQEQGQKILAQLTRELQEDEITFFIRRGHGPLGFTLHAQHLEWLLNRTSYDRNATPSPENLLRLKQYVYLYCARKMKQRLDMEISGGRGKFIDLFLGTDRTTYCVAYEDYQKLTLIEPPDQFPDFRPKWSDEKWLVGIPRDFGGEVKLDAADPRFIERTAEAGYSVYLCISIHLRMLHRGLSVLLAYSKASSSLREADAENREEVKNALTDVANALHFLHWGLSHSRAFWRTIFTLGPHFQIKVVSTFIEHHYVAFPVNWVVLFCNPTQLEGTTVDSPPPRASGEQVAGPDESTSAASLGDTCLNEGGMKAKGAIEPGENYDETGDWDFGPTTDLRITPLIEKVRRWFTFLTQWHHTLCDLEAHLPSICNNLTAPLEIQARYADHVPNLHQQAGLFKTLDFVDPSIDLASKVAAIKAAVSKQS